MSFLIDPKQMRGLLKASESLKPIKDDMLHINRASDGSGDIYVETTTSHDRMAVTEDGRVYNWKRQKRADAR